MILDLVNASLKTGYEPKAFNIVIIKPLLLKTYLDPGDVSRCGSISNLSFISKIIEKVVADLLIVIVCVERNYMINSHCDLDLITAL